MTNQKEDLIREILMKALHTADTIQFGQIDISIMCQDNRVVSYELSSKKKVKVHKQGF